MTSNLGASLIRERFEHLTDSNRDQVIGQTRDDVMEMLKKTIRPEFLNRIDEIIMFTPLDEEQIRQIVTMQLTGIKKMLAKNGITLEVTDAAIALLGKAGYDPEFGARPVKRAIQSMVLNQLSKDIIAARVNRDRPIIIDASDGQLVFKN
jgi:ATP-dependent Clp protease ATP-binding subunit ClpB